MTDGTGLADTMFGVDGLSVIDAKRTRSELVLTVESTKTAVYCPSCRKPATPQDRKDVELRDMACFERAVRLVWRKRRWRCERRGCMKKTWTETHPAIAPRQVLTNRAGIVNADRKREHLLTQTR